MKTPLSIQITRYFLASAAALLAALATALLLTNLASASLIQPRDPLFGIPMNTLFWIVGLAAVLVIPCCHWLRSSGTKQALILWFATNLIAVRLGWQWQGVSDPAALLATMANTFHISNTLIISLLSGACLYLCLGSTTLLLRDCLIRRPALEPANTSVPITASSRNSIAPIARRK